MATSAGLAAVLGLAGAMGYGDLRARSDEVAVPTKAAAVTPTAPAEKRPIKLETRRVVKTVTPGGGSAAPTGGSAVARSRTAPAPASAPAVTTSGSN